MSRAVTIAVIALEAELRKRESERVDLLFEVGDLAVLVDVVAYRGKRHFVYEFLVAVGARAYSVHVAQRSVEVIVENLAEHGGRGYVSGVFV